MNIKGVIIFTFLVGILTSSNCFPQNQQREINNQIWQVQLDAMHSNQVDKFISIMSDEVVQISYNRNTIRNKDEFRNQAKITYQTLVDRKLSRTMEFRFLNRIATEQNAFEDGFFKYELTNEKLERQTYFGYFQVVLRKEKQQWKVLVDYDSENYNGVPVTQELFQNAKSMDSYDH